MRRDAAEVIAGVWRRDGVTATLLTPFSWLFGAAVRMRNGLYDAGLLRVIPLGAPTVSVGNLTVGGTGKTPITAWIAAHLASRGRRPGILLRGYRGEDETLVHRALVPGAPVIADPDRVRGAAKARAAGADVLVLDDGFQHRRAARHLDIVLVATEQGSARRLLPAGPLRERVGALARADVLLVTRKTASQDEAADVATEWSEGHEQLLIVVAALLPGQLVRLDAGGSGAPETRGLETLRGTSVLAISAIGSPRQYVDQLRATGAEVRPVAFPDHHPFTDAEVAALARDAAGVETTICTLKDAVKLRGRWPREAPPLWYLSQAVAVEWGAEALRERLDRLGGLAPT